MQWISMKDQKPPEQSQWNSILLFDGKEVFCGTYEDGDFGNQPCDGTCYGWYEKGEITHWMPLPEAPKSEPVSGK